MPYENEAEGLPARVHKLLSRFGSLQGEPEIFDGGFDVSAVTAIACFETIEAAQARVPYMCLWPESASDDLR